MRRILVLTLVLLCGCAKPAKMDIHQEARMIFEEEMRKHPPDNNQQMYIFFAGQRLEKCFTKEELKEIYSKK